MPKNFKTLEDIDKAIANLTDDRINDAISLLSDLRANKELIDALIRARKTEATQS